MKRILLAVLLAGFAAVSFAAGNGQYNNEAGSQDQHAPQVG
jgi:hypothetical protein